eukprot:SAG22_NODE_109_length_19706_cov_464.723772_13_plen_322_part_01
MSAEQQHAARRQQLAEMVGIGAADAENALAAADGDVGAAVEWLLAGGGGGDQPDEQGAPRIEVGVHAGKAIGEAMHLIEAEHGRPFALTWLPAVMPRQPQAAQEWLRDHAADACWGASRAPGNDEALVLAEQLAREGTGGRQQELEQEQEAADRALAERLAREESGPGDQQRGGGDREARVAAMIAEHGRIDQQCDTGDAAGAAARWTALLAEARALGHKQAEDIFLGNLGTVYNNLGRQAEAIDHHTQALAISREIGDRRGEGTDLGNLGIAYRSLGRQAEAIDHLTQALAISREVGDRRGEGNRLGNLGSAYDDLGRYAE